MDALSRFTAAVVAAGYKNLGDYGLKKGYRRETIYHVVKRWGNEESMPQGITGHRIITALRKLERKQGVQS